MNSRVGNCHCTTSRQFRRAPGLPGIDSITALVLRLRQARPLASALHVARQLLLERLTELDIEPGATLAQATGAMTALKPDLAPPAPDNLAPGHE